MRSALAVPFSDPAFLAGLAASPEDALRAVEAGMDGIVVSNHGGRQVERAVGSLSGCPVSAVEGRAAVLFDSGVRTGADVAVALALGADAVLLGRPYACGLALGGQDGVTPVLRSVLAGMDLTSALAGHADLGGLAWFPRRAGRGARVASTPAARRAADGRAPTPQRR